MNIPLGFAWPEVLWEKELGKCLAKLPAARRSPEALEQLGALGPEAGKKAADHNLLIGQALGTANEIAIRYRLSNRHLTADEFLREYNTGASKEDFLVYMGARADERYRRGQITQNTHKSHHSTLNKLREFIAYGKRPTRSNLGKKPAPAPGSSPADSVLPFCDLTHKLSHDFDAWLKTACESCQNTRSGRHRNVKAYLELARRDKITFEDPYEYFVNSTVAGQWKALTEAELAKLEEHYNRLDVGSTHRHMLQKFLFSCHCGLRLGDLKQMASVKVVGQQMVLQPHKTYRYDEKDLLLPITKRALRYLTDSQTENECEGFRIYSDQYTNRQLGIIGTNLRIETKLHHHIGRETFATNFIRRGGKVEVLQKLLGHKKLSMTMKYVHVDEAMKQAEIDRLDELDS
ncbi:site-specific integrase [Hymenobacter sp. H14-R3]|uniref:site-specific integrase n=1 Tax=Hymenobacter sp. H14-R3 TaxID=3046308 RepID=UPI0024B9989B|nr:site-specific integrase [Hymenobacter sp. H14-R3]MDJ0367513.1 site-specific integrase [Hymenobacter sp. H14-R3]